jgi:nucleotide-binding universal stress UspA family protein
MIKFKAKKNLVPYDFSKNADYALKHAAFIASYNKGDVYLLYVKKKSELLDMFLPTLNLNKKGAFLDFVIQKLDDTINSLKKEYGITAKKIVSEGNITDEINQVANDDDMDLVIMGTRGKDSQSDIFFGSNSYRLITKTSVPVMTVSTDPKIKGYDHILLPIDLSSHSRQKVNYAIDLAKLFNAQITALGIYDESEKTEKYKLEVINSQIEKLCEKKDVKFVGSIEKTKHRVQKTLSYAKRHKADLIITMTDQKIELNKSILSTYDHELINFSKNPVISIPPENNPDASGSTAGLPY